MRCLRLRGHGESGLHGSVGEAAERAQQSAPIDADVIGAKGRSEGWSRDTRLPMAVVLVHVVADASDDEPATRVPAGNEHCHDGASE